MSKPRAVKIFVLYSVLEVFKYRDFCIYLKITALHSIVFCFFCVGADDPQAVKSAAGLLNSSEFSGIGGDYFSAGDLKTNLGLEELQMLDESNIINDPPLEDSLHLDSI